MVLYGPADSVARLTPRPIDFKELFGLRNAAADAPAES